MKIIFLDIDGVLATPNSCQKEKSWRSFDCECVENLNELVEKTNSDIVISSTWRRFNELQDLRYHFENYGFRFKDRIIDRTPFLPGQDRGLEILEWLKDKKVDKFFIIDDDVFDIKLHFDSNQYIKNSFNDGFTKKDLKTALSLMLN